MKRRPLWSFFIVYISSRGVQTKMGIDATLDDESKVCNG